eukprot:TRINITY_DN18061_c0_g1_i1.p1 TRINITY_DN18061_c0_g1~~TRINITY_DN18061_c0_g1_i1.p1  ORF type:complete len:720 (-),score=179.33 TRINITY_DN18061_c0_g1_i1:90-1958(-)
MVITDRIDKQLPLDHEARVLRQLQPLSTVAPFYGEFRCRLAADTLPQFAAAGPSLPPAVMADMHAGADVQARCFLHHFYPTTLADVLRSKVTISDAQALLYTTQMLQAVCDVHWRNVSHTALRPESFCVTPQGGLVLCGFDRAEMLIVPQANERPPEDASCSLKEQIKRKNAETRMQDLTEADVFAVGCIAFQLMAGQVHLPEELQYHLPLSGDVLFPSYFSPDLVSFVKTLLERDTSQRITAEDALAVAKAGLKQQILIHPSAPRTAEMLTTQALLSLNTGHARVLLEESLRLDSTFIPAVLALRAVRLYFPRHFNCPTSAEPAFKDHIGILNRRAQNAPDEAQHLADRFFTRDPVSPAWLVVKASWLRNVRHNSPDAAKVAEQAAEQGYAPAQAWLGVCYEHGSGVKKDIRTAAHLYQLAAEQGLAQGQCWLGVCYENGRGVTKDVHRAVQLYTQAGAGDQGLAQALCCLGVCYENGTGVVQNAAEAVRLYRLAAERGLARALCCLGVCYANGKGVQKEVSEAVRYYKLSAENGYPRAQFYLAQRSENGDGVTKDVNDAIRLYSLAADQGHGQSLMRLGVCYEAGHGVRHDIREAVRLWKYAHDQGALKAADYLRPFVPS